MTGTTGRRGTAGGAERGTGAPPFGAVIAGGRSTRYGAPKALAEVGGIRIVDRVLAALRSVTPTLVVSANEADLYADLELPIYRDEQPGLGALGGIQTLLLRAREADRPGIVALACDLPFPSVALLETIVATAFPAAGADAPDVVIPESQSRRGVEPLFAAYRTAALPAIEAAIRAGDRRMIGFHDAVTVHRIPLAEVERVCDPERAFLNVNTPAERTRAEAMIEEEEDRE